MKNDTLNSKKHLRIAYDLINAVSDSKEKIGVREIRTVIENAKHQNLKVLL